jgi:4'-phosphopantetheinyl transferase
MKQSLKSFKFLRKNSDEYQAQLFWCCDYEDKNLEEVKNILHESEHKRYDEILSLKRKKSFLFGRYAAKKALAEFCNISKLPEISIVNGVFGQPVIHHRDIKNIQISIAHTDKMAAAIVFQEEYPMALDIEEIDECRSDFVKSQFTKDELNLSKNFSDSEQNIFNLVLWTAKEALAKVVKVGLTVPLVVLEIETIAKDIINNGEIILTYKNFKQYQCRSFILGQHICSIVCPKA